MNPMTSMVDSNKPFLDVSAFGASPEASAGQNTEAFNAALQGGHRTVFVSQPGVYPLEDTIYLDSHTELICARGVVLRKDAPYPFVFINRGALKRTTDENILLSGLRIEVNGYDCIPPVDSSLFGLRGHVSFFYVRNVRIYDLTIPDIAKTQFGVHFCTFFNISVDSFALHGDKDGIHLGRGDFFRIANGVTETFDDAVALNAHDYPSANPEVGDIRNGIIENILDMAKPSTSGFFSRCLLGAWIEWYPGVKVQHGDAVVSNGRTYRVVGPTDTTFVSVREPLHEAGVIEDAGGFGWKFMQPDAVMSANIENIHFRNITGLEQRPLLSVEVDTGGHYNRSIHPDIGPERYPCIRGIRLDGISVRQTSGAVISCPAHVKYAISLSNVVEAHTTLFKSGPTDSGSFRLSNSNLDSIQQPVIDGCAGAHVRISGCDYTDAIPVRWDQGARLNTAENVNSMDGLHPHPGDRCTLAGVPRVFTRDGWKSFKGV